MVTYISLPVTMNTGKRISLLTSFLRRSVILKHLHHPLPVRNFVIKKCKWCWAWNFLTVCCYQFWLFLPSFKWYWFAKFPPHIFENHSTIQQNFPIFVMGSRWLVCIMLKRHPSEIIIALYRDYYRQSDQNFPSRQKHRDQSIVNTSCQKFNKSIVRLKFIEKFTAVSLLWIIKLGILWMN